MYHVLGNHCVRMPREQLQDRLGMPSAYRSLALPGKWRLLLLDTTEMSGHSNLDQAGLSVLGSRLVHAAP